MTAPLSVARLPPRRRRRLGLVVLVLLFALFLLLSNLVPLSAEWLWFQALGYERVFTTRLVAEAVLGVAVGGAAFAVLYANLDRKRTRRNSSHGSTSYGVFCLPA